MASQFIWLGGHDSQNEGLWKWISNGKPFTYTNWGSGEPSNWHPWQKLEEDCMGKSVYPDSSRNVWNDYPCSANDMTTFVCEIDLKQ